MTEYRQGLSKEDSEARELIAILGRTMPTITAVEKVKRLILWCDNVEEILADTLKVLYMRDVKLNKKHDSIDFINSIKNKKKK